jgi:hypothetical protein
MVRTTERVIYLLLLIAVVGNLLIPPGEEPDHQEGAALS